MLLACNSFHLVRLGGLFVLTFVWAKVPLFSLCCLLTSLEHTFFPRARASLPPHVREARSGCFTATFASIGAQVCHFHDVWDGVPTGDVFFKVHCHSLFETEFCTWLANACSTLNPDVFPRQQVAIGPVTGAFSGTEECKPSLHFLVAALALEVPFGRGVGDHVAFWPALLEVCSPFPGVSF